MLSVLIMHAFRGFSKNSDSPRQTRVKRCKSRQQDASLTVEAAMVMPMFLFFFYFVMQLFLFIMVQLSVCRTVTSTMQEYGSLAYLERRERKEDAGVASLGYLPVLTLQLSKVERAERQLVLCFPDEENLVRISVSYYFFYRVPFLPELSVPVVQRFSYYPYLGEYDPDRFVDEEEPKEDVVYVTKTGKVYHERLSCTYLKLSVQEILFPSLSVARNEEGRKYAPCAKCKEGMLPDKVFITDKGDKYHWTAKCSALKRDVTEIPRSKIGERHACSRCGKEE